MKNTLKLAINILFDSKAQVYVATSDDVLGLVVESETFDGVLSELQHLVPELLIANGVITQQSSHNIDAPALDLLIQHTQQLALSM